MAFLGIFVFILWCSIFLLRRNVCFCCAAVSLSVLSQVIGSKKFSEMTYFVSGGT